MLRMCFEHAPSGFQNGFRRDRNRVMKTMMIKFNVTYHLYRCRQSSLMLTLAYLLAYRKTGFRLLRVLDVLLLPNKQNFDQAKFRQKFHHSWKKHHKISIIPNFRCEML